MNKYLQVVFLMMFGLSFFVYRLGANQVGAESQQDISLKAQLPAIHNISTNESEYPNNQVPRYKKLEITFQVDTQAINLQLPYDETPPPGIEPGAGVSVDALFTSDAWKTVYTQPAFYYQEFLDEVKRGNEWFYPTENFSWKVRFAPTIPGEWQYRIRVRDAYGVYETSPRTFQAAYSDGKGFIRVSGKDPRYFEYEDGSYFPALGYNMNFDRVSWTNPVLDNLDNFQIMSQNGIQLARIWLTEWGIYGPSWNPWNSINPDLYDRQIPFVGLTFEEAYPGSLVSMRINAERNPCMFIGRWKAKPAVKTDTDYRVRIRYKTAGIDGPRVAGQPYGFMAKTGKSLWGEGQYCEDPGTGERVTGYQSANVSGWQILEGSWNSGNNNFLPDFYLTLENVNGGVAYVDYVWIEEDLGNGSSFGPNIVSKPWMAHHLYMEQRNSFAFDKALELAETYDIYFKMVLLEKNDWIFRHLNHEGNIINDDPLCSDQDPRNDPPECPGSVWSYGNWRNLTAVRWYQQAYWRYAQARWGYSTSVHSWELLNEGDPSSGRHHTLADEFGKYMRQFAPNHHLATTSTWHSFPHEAFWANPAFPHVDYANYHLYISEDEPLFNDTGLATYQKSMEIGAKQPGGAGKPTMRGEIGFTAPGGTPATTLLSQDTDAIWLHNFIWGGINAGGLIESYWYDKTHIYRPDSNDGYWYDYRSHYRRFYNFIRNIPLNNGHYREAEVASSHTELRAWGQIDAVNGRAHLWIQNIHHTWKNVVDGAAIPSASGTIEVSGFFPGAAYNVLWWDTYQLDPDSAGFAVTTLFADSDGILSLDIEDLTADLAVKITPEIRYYLPLVRSQILVTPSSQNSGALKIC